MRQRFCTSVLIVLFYATSAVRSQQLSSQPVQGAKACVAVVRNESSESLLVERMTDRLTEGLVQNKLVAVTIDSETTRDRQLHATVQNSEQMKSRECDYLVLTQVVDRKDNIADPQAPGISIGKKVPSIDASDPLGGTSGPVYRGNLEVHFAVFRPGHLKADLDTDFPAQPASTVSDSLLPAMDRVANRVSHEIKKK